jgi:hypothetical protein
MPAPFGEEARAARLFAVPMFAALVVSQIFPGTQQQLRLPVLALTVFSAVCFVLCSSGRLFLHRIVVAWTVFFVAVGLFWVEWGLVNRAPGALAVTTVYVMWPLVFLLFVNMMNTVEQFRRLAITFFVACWLVVIADVGYLSEQLGYVPWRFFSLIDSRNGFSLTPFGPIYTSSRVGVMLFAIPVLASLILHRWQHGQGKRLVLVCWVLLLPMLVLTLLSQRRAVYVVVLLTPFVALSLDALMPIGNEKLRSRAIQTAMPVLLMVVAVAVLGYFGIGLGWADRIEDLLQGFDFSGKAGAGDIETNARALQLRAMMTDWMESPILGMGHGAATSVVRDSQMPWAYELTYMALLFQTGTLGFLAYFSGIAWLIYQLLLIHRDASSPVRLYAYGMLNGMVGLLIGSATNPYLVTFDSLWAVFMPIGLVNLELLRKRGF